MGETMRWSADNCTLGRAMTVLGERWTVVVIREVFLGVRRFDDIAERSGMPRQVLTNRLKLLVEEGILRKVPYQEAGSRAREEYRLTERGFDLYPVLISLKAWGDRYLGGGDGTPVLMVHRDCEAEVGGVLRCRAGHEIDDPRQIVPRPGPAALPRHLRAAGE